MTSCLTSRDARTGRMSTTDWPAQVEDMRGFVRLTVQGEMDPNMDLRETDLRESLDSFDAVQIRRGQIHAAYDIESLKGRTNRKRTVRARCHRCRTAVRRGTAGADDGATRPGGKGGSRGPLMHFESVTCRAFGPFRNRTLSLRPGMNVIYGPNEAGKSTWLAAIAAGLCGRRRKQGTTKEDREFSRRHRPWDDPKEWAASAVIHLTDGRQIELSHDLAGGVDSSARDARYANRDLSSEVMNDGAPDGAIWLGLKRRSFQSVACVRQSEILSILGDADELQADLQRAAATARTDATASDAVSRLVAFRGEQVGSHRSPTKPLLRSEAALETAKKALTDAAQAHASFRCRRRKVDTLEREVRRDEMRIAAAAAVLAEADASAARKRHTEASELSECFLDGPPRESSDGDQLAQRIVTALDRWRELRDTSPPTGPTVAEIEKEIASSEAEEKALLGRPRRAGPGRRAAAPGPGPRTRRPLSRCTTPHGASRGRGDRTAGQARHLRSGMRGRVPGHQQCRP